jgi:hypothetical protein
VTTTINTAACRPPATNNRGQPWSSAGRRNLGWIGTGLGNGGTQPPGDYERRRHCIEDRPHDRMWREHWLRCLLSLLGDGELTPTQYTIGVALADVSNANGKPVFPGHKYLGERVGRSRSTVQRTLARLRALGLLEWEHRFLAPNSESDHARGTSNLYDFRLPADVLARLGLRQPRPPRHHHGGRHTPPKRDLARDQALSTAAAAAQAASNATFRDAAEEIEALYSDDAEMVSFALDALAGFWQQYRSPPDSAP